MKILMTQYTSHIRSSDYLCMAKTSGCIMYVQKCNMLSIGSVLMTLFPPHLSRNIIDGIPFNQAKIIDLMIMGYTCNRRWPIF